MKINKRSLLISSVVGVVAFILSPQPHLLSRLFGVMLLVFMMYSINSMWDTWLSKGVSKNK